MAHLQRALASIARQEHAMSVGLGPHGLDQLLIDEANQPVITNSGDVILSSASPDDALGALILKLVADSCASLGDASKRVLLMVLSGLRQYLRSGLHPHTFQHDLAAQVLQCVVPSAVLHVPLPPGGPQPGDEAAEALHALIRTHLVGKAGGQAAEQRLADCLQELVLLQLRAAAAAGRTAAEALSSLRDGLPLARLPGAPPSQTRLLRGVVLGEGPLAGPGVAGPLTSPTFIALSCPLDGEAITCVRQSAGGVDAPNDGGGGGGGPAVAIRVVSEAQRGEVEAAAVELLRQRIAMLAERGVELLLLCHRPPPIATQLCHQYGITLVAGLDEQDAARACAAGGGGPPLSRSGLAALAAAPLGRAAAARVVGLGPRRAVLLEFGERQWQAAGEAACTLLLCGVSEVAVRQAARAVRRCLISLAAAVGSMDYDDAAAAAAAAAAPAAGGVECLVFVAGGGGFEGLLELQLRELMDVARRGPSGDNVEEGGDKGGEGQEGVAETAAEVAEAAAAEAGSVSELVASLRILHAMAAAVPRALTGAAGGGGGGVTGRGGGGQQQLRAQREALLQVQQLRQCQAEVLRSNELVRCGLLVPSAALSFYGRALRDGDAAGGGGGVQQDEHGKYGSDFVRARPPLGGHSFVAARDVVSYGVVEPAAVAASAWNHAVDVVRQVVRIYGPPAAAVASQRRGGGGGPFLAVGPAPAEAPRARRGGRRAGGDSGSGSNDSSDGGGGGDSGGDSD
ncbi:hypothetical protein PLESTB_000400600 [Pleodorina starrii]|uniref:Uncharacterized protein n=1 Tax=Pleodorina starrii TaxID=330485 RepID=A0A9W6EZI0_9CHLO|nr:hypothetical protein PLESTB_000400600 [Pleodorina starrii]